VESVITIETMKLRSPLRFPAVVRGLSLVLLTLAWANVNRAGEMPALLKEAFAKSKDLDDHWAYTETTFAHVKHNGEEATVSTIVRFDPSKPYAEQYTPLKVSGHDPTAKELKEYREKGEQRLKEREAAALKPKKSKEVAAITEAIDPEHIVLKEETASSATYAVPVKKGKMNGIDLSKFELLFLINREKKIVERLTVNLREPMRVKLIANIKSGTILMHFSQVDPNFPPVMTKLEGTLNATLFFKKFSTEADMIRNEYKRVRPFDERFSVEIGALKALDR
jgi:hypothetical protein